MKFARVQVERTMAGMLRSVPLLAIMALLATAPRPALAQAQSAEPPAQQQSAEQRKQADQPDQHHPGVAGELVEETREAAGEEEENANLKHAKPVQWLAKQDWLERTRHASPPVRS